MFKKLSRNDPLQSSRKILASLPIITPTHSVSWGQKEVLEISEIDILFIRSPSLSSVGYKLRGKLLQESAK